MRIYLMVTSWGDWEDYGEAVEGAYLSKEKCQKAVDDYNQRLHEDREIARVANKMYNKLYDKYEPDNYDDYDEDVEDEIEEKIKEEMGTMYEHVRDSWDLYDMHNAQMREYKIVDAEDNTI